MRLQSEEQQDQMMTEMMQSQQLLETKNEMLSQKQ